MPVWSAGPSAIPITALRCQCGEKTTSRWPTRNLTNAVVALRPERGYWATDYDASADQLPETLRRQIGRAYDAKKVRNR